VSRGEAGPARHERPELDELAMAAARRADLLLAEARRGDAARWQEFLAPIPNVLRDSSLADLRRVARLARAAYGPRDSIRDALPARLTEPFLASLDRLLAALAKEDLAG
jgi:hypothetical protein